MPVTAGRNDPCPCGSGKKYKKCCERVVAIQSAEQVREERERKAKSRLVTELNRWFEEVCSEEIDEIWDLRFKEFFHLPADKPIPANLTYTYRFWILFDAPCYHGQRPVEVWREQLSERTSESDRMAQELTEVHLCCYEVIEVGEGEARLRSLVEEKEFLVRLDEPIKEGMLMFARLSRLVNRYELFGPYTAFGVEMRGEILVHLNEQIQRKGDLKREYWQQNGMQVLGWLMKRARELENSDQPETLPEVIGDRGEDLKDLPKVAPIEDLFRMPTVPEEKASLPDVVGQQFQLFYDRYVSLFQEKTRELYQESLDLLKDYLSIRFGESFTWSLLDEQVLSHFFGVWYVDKGKGGPIRSRIFLNTLKGLFRWIREEAICDIYPTFASVYKESIQELPRAFEARRWLAENGLSKEMAPPFVEGIFQLGISSTGASLEIGGQWIPLQANIQSPPPAGLDNRFWVRGKLSPHPREARMVSVEAVYPYLRVFERELAE
ncbi:SEC-C motif-containing protein [Melghirimyces thermohalophilus]|uniref:SEC-C motif-containing protein n=1 Tax=Melghirimyces thermohalophilus TaxID=1236220 RepID=A0A1G6HNF0_9BACL|nr:SEC-C metal-binding domain-containing protein [Melghirimyces thermohalophilus]SDB95789.1 SEC-C motif-containing protein [Melghirimyces thermohalophilus]